MFALNPLGPVESAPPKLVNFQIEALNGEWTPGDVLIARAEYSGGRFIVDKLECD